MDDERQSEAASVPDEDAAPRPWVAPKLTALGALDSGTGTGFAAGGDSTDGTSPPNVS